MSFKELLWFHIMWWVVAQKTGDSAYNLNDFMGFGSYETAWLWLHKPRRAMVRKGREKLTGTVEVDEFAFRFNRKLSTLRGLLFYRLMQQAVTTTPVTYMDIIK